MWTNRVTSTETKRQSNWLQRRINTVSSDQNNTNVFICVNYNSHTNKTICMLSINCIFGKKVAAILHLIHVAKSRLFEKAVIFKMTPNCYDWNEVSLLSPDCLLVSCGSFRLYLQFFFFCLLSKLSRRTQNHYEIILFKV